MIQRGFPNGTAAVDFREGMIGSGRPRLIPSRFVKSAIGFFSFVVGVLGCEIGLETEA